jgi:hypothetical protein
MTSITKWLMTATVTSLLAMCFQISPSQAQYYGDAPWCAVVSAGTGNMVSYCYYRTVEECVPNVLAGNRGFCNVNPYGSSSLVQNKAARPKHHRSHI